MNGVVIIHDVRDCHQANRCLLRYITHGRISVTVIQTYAPAGSQRVPSIGAALLVGARKNSTPDGRRNGFCAVRHLEFLHNAVYVVADGVVTDIKSFRNLLICRSLC